jgi:Ku70/Ku80 beta-barrel domain
VIRETIREMNKVAIGRVVLTNREHIIALEPLDKGLMGTLLRYPYEVRDPQEYFDDIQDVKVTKDIRSNTFEMEWPPRSGRRRTFPEIDRAAWFGIADARRRILKGQTVFVDRLVEARSIA